LTNEAGSNVSLGKDEKRRGETRGYVRRIYVLVNEDLETMPARSTVYGIDSLRVFNVHH
jgi:hypothetical protein